MGLIPGSGRSVGGGHGNPFHFSCLENPMDRGAWWDTALGIAKSWAQLKQLSRARLIPEPSTTSPYTYVCVRAKAL